MMPFAIHLLHRFDRHGRPHILTLLERDSYRTCCWELSASDAGRLVRGWVYLHDRKSIPARMGGLVTAVEPADEPAFAEPDHFAITFTSRAEARQMHWRGASHPEARMGGLVAADAPHERAVDG